MNDGAYPNEIGLGSIGDLPASDQRAVVIGGGIAGLLASRVLKDHYDEVVLLERDHYPSAPEPRPGVPQSHHVHLLLLRGKRILNRLFPGLTDDLVSQGASAVEMGHELAVLNYHGWRARYEGGLELLTFTRPLLEWLIRRRLAEAQRIIGAQGYRVTGLIEDDGEGRIIGVRCEASNGPRTKHELHCDLVVDASGRFSEAPSWLAEHGYPQPEETVVDPLLGYASRLYIRHEDDNSLDELRPGWKAILLMGQPPDFTRAGVLLPVEGDRWHVTLIGISGDYPPTDETGFHDFARSLRSSVISEAIENAQPCSTISGSRSTENRRGHYRDLDRQPEQFIVVGDALCSLNPIYAQGMSVAAMHAITLDRCLREYGSSAGDADGAARRIQGRIEETIDIPWLLATGDDVRWPKTEGARHRGLPMRLAHRYLDAVSLLATEDPDVDRALTRVAHLVAPIQELFRPRIALRAAARIINPFTAA